MSAEDPRPITSEPQRLWGDVVTARRCVTRARRHPAPREARHPLGPARAELLRALECYVDCLEERGWPVPYGLRDELRLLRRTSPPGSWSH